MQGNWHKVLSCCGDKHYWFYFLLTIIGLIVARIRKV